MRCRSSKAILLSIVLMVGWAAWPVPAQAVTTGEIETGLQDWLTSTLAAPHAGMSATLGGQVSATEAGAGFHAVLPPIQLRLGSALGPEFLIDPIAIELQPLAGGGFAANWTLPERIEMRGQDGSAVAITIGRQSGHGLYSPEIGLMISSDLEFHDIRAAAPDRPPHLSLDSLVFGARHDALAPGLFDQSTELRITGLTALKEDGTEAMRIADISLSGGASGVHLAAWRDLQSSFPTPFTHRPKTSAGVSEPIAPSLVASSGLLAEDRPTLLASVQGRHQISDARFDFGDGDISIGDGALDLSMDGLDSGSASMAIAFQVSDLELPSPIGPLTPRGMVVDLVLSGLPTERLFDGLTALVAGIGLPNSGPALAMFGLHLQDLMMTSGGRIEINEILLTADDAHLRVAGTIKPSHSAPLGVVAQLDMSIGGMDSLIADARADPAGDATVQQLTLLQAVGAADTNPDGTPIMGYALEINQLGQILLNGADLVPALAVAAP